MESFEDKRRQPKRLDSYEKDVTKMMDVMKDMGIVKQSVQQNLSIEASSEQEVRKFMTLKALKSKAVLWGLILSVVSMNTFSYRYFVKFAKKRLGLVGFWPVHFAIFVPMNLMNFTFFGVVDSVFQWNDYEEKMQAIRD